MKSVLAGVLLGLILLLGPPPARALWQPDPAQLSPTTAGSACSGGTFTTTLTNPPGTLSGACISTTSGPCVVYSDGGTHTLQASQIGPCGTNNTNTDSQGVKISGGTTVNLYDNYIHVENQSSNCLPNLDTHDGVYLASNGTAAVNIQGNVIAFSENDVGALDSSNLSVYGNYLLNPTGNTSCSSSVNLAGNGVQSWGSASVTGTSLTYNYFWSCTTGFPFAGTVDNGFDIGNNSAGLNQNAVVSNNWLGLCNGLSGNSTVGGIVFDNGATGGQAENNVCSEFYNNCIDLSGTGPYTVSGNKALISVLSTSYATGIAINGATCSTGHGISITGNVASAFQSAPPATGYNQAYYNSGSCASPTLSGNTFDTGCSGGGCTAYAALNPMATSNPPPLIPPVPKNCVAKSPYTTQTGTRCS